MPVTTRIITADSGSSRSVSGDVKSPDVIQVKTVLLDRARLAAPADAAPAPAATRHGERRRASRAQATPPETAFGSRRPRQALTRKPRNGRSGISAARIGAVTISAP